MVATCKVPLQVTWSSCTFPTLELRGDATQNGTSTCAAWELAGVNVTDAAGAVSRECRGEHGTSPR